MNVVSLSGGKDSTAMLLMMLERGIPVDKVINWDSGIEFPQMYDHLAKIEKYTGIEITRLHIDKTFEYWAFEHENKSKYDNRGYGWPRSNARWCTTMKTTALDKELKGIDDVHQFVGIAYDEPKRIREKEYPLVEWKVTEKDALAYCYEHGFDFGGLYEHKKRVSCWCCPLQSIGDLRVLRRFYPDLWNQLIEMDERSFNDFRHDYTLEQLSRRFKQEDRQLVMELGA